MNFSNGERPPGKRCVPKIKESPKIVPGFCVQVYQKNTKVAGPKKILLPKATTGQARRTSPQTMFAIDYERGWFPLAVVYSSTERIRPFRWLMPIEMIDYNIYLPILVDGLREPPMPYGRCAAHGLWDLIARDTTGNRVLRALPRIVYPLRQALNAGSGNWSCVVRALKTLQLLIMAGGKGHVGKALIPYFRNLLRPFDRFRRAIYVNSTDGVTSRPLYNIAELTEVTLSLLEFTGGRCAYVNIKYMIPTYEHSSISCLKPTVLPSEETGSTVSPLKETGSTLSSLEETGSTVPLLEKTGSAFRPLKMTETEMLALLKMGSILPSLMQTRPTLSSLLLTESPKPRSPNTEMQEMVKIFPKRIVTWLL